MGRQDWRTPPSVFRALEAFFVETFDCDVAADEHNHLCDNWRGEKHHHFAWGRFNFCNPPFGNIMPFVARAIAEAAVPHGYNADTIMLTHNGCCSEWFRLASQHATLYLPNRRISFWHPDEEPGSPDRDTVVWHFGYDAGGFVKLINIPEHADEVRRLWAEANGQGVLL